MTVRAYPYDTTDAAGSVTELEWRRLMQWISPSGVLRGEDNELAVTQRAAGANMSVDVDTGAAFMVGHYLRNDAVASVAIANNATGNPRIDTIVVGVDFVANTGSIYVLQGVAAAAPAPTALTQDLTSLWEEAIAYVAVAAGASVSITNAMISDCRHFAMPQAQDQDRVARLATTAALAASTITGVNRVANANGALANIDGTAAAVGDVILDKDHATGSSRGLWRIVDVGSASKPWRMRRSYAADTSAKVRAGLWIRVAEGTANADTGWLLTTNDPIVLGTTALTFTQFPTGATTFAGARLTKSANQSTANTTPAVISFDGESYDVGNWHDNVTNNTRLTVPAAYAGKVLVVGCVTFENVAGTGFRSASIKKNGSDINAASAASLASQYVSVWVTDIVLVAAGDYLELAGSQGSGGNANVMGSGIGPYTSLMCVFLGA